MMSTKKKAAPSFQHFMRAESLLACMDVIIGVDGLATLVRLIDQVPAFAFPILLQRFILVAQLSRDTSISLEEFNAAQLEHKFVVVNPKGQVTELGGGKSVVNPAAPWTTNRCVIDLSGKLSLSQEGVYVWRILGRTADTDFETLAERRIPTMLVKGLPGFYDVHFETGRRGEQQGSGLVMLSPDGSIQGGDGGYGYSGRYELDEHGRIMAKIHVQRMHPDAISVFGPIDAVDLDLSGQVAEDAITLSGGATPESTQGAISVALKRKIHLPFPQ